jgi:hypothetical protein
VSPDGKHVTNDHGRARRRAVAATLVLVLALVLGVSVLLRSVWPVDASAASKPTIATAPFQAPSGVTPSTTSPPWLLPADSRPYIAAAHLPVLSAEQLEVHYHAHLDVIANGSAVTVPAGIGFVIDQGKATGITTVHTHDPSGIIHIESASNDAYTLGQVFTEWGVALGGSQLGGFQVDDGHVLQAFVNGRRFQGDPATILLRPHLEIALWYGPAGAHPKVPKSYHFPAGL